MTIARPSSVPVLVVGEALIDVVVRPDAATAEHVGGSPANVAIGISRLGHPAVLATSFGRDPRGDAIRETLARSGVGLTPCSDAADRTSTATARIGDDGAATYDFDLTWEVAGSVRAPDGGHVHTGSIAAVLEPGAGAVRDLVQAARQNATISYDPNVRPSLMGSPEEALGAINAIIGLSDVVKASDEDCAWLRPAHTPGKVRALGEVGDDEGELGEVAGETAKLDKGAELGEGVLGEQGDEEASLGEVAALSEMTAEWVASGASLAVITRGGDGVFVRKGAETAVLPAATVTVVDTVGAGDSFMSGLVSGLLDAGLLGGPQARVRLVAASLEDVLPAVRRALACAAITVTRAGANPPTRDELPAD